MNRWCNIIMIGSALAVFLLTVVVGIQSRRNNYKGIRFMCSDPDMNYEMLHTTSNNGSNCEDGDILTTQQVPFNACYNNGHADQRDEVVEYSCHGGRPEIIKITSYTTNDGSCGDVDYFNEYYDAYSMCSGSRSGDGIWFHESFSLVKIT